MGQSQLRDAEYILSMLERLSADSIYAHRASGLRGSILRLLGELERDTGDEMLFERLRFLVSQGYDIVEKAASELRGGEDAGTGPASLT